MQQGKNIREEQLNTRPKVRRKSPESSEIQQKVKRTRTEGVSVERPRKKRPVVDEEGRPVERPKKKRPVVDEEGRPVERPKKKRPVVDEEGRPIERPKKKRPVVDEEGRPVERPKKKRPVVDEEGRPVERPKKKRPEHLPEEYPIKRTVQPGQKQTTIQKTKTQKKTFKKAFLTTFIIFSAILIAALICLWLFLSDFEKSRPEHYAQTIIKNIEAGRYDALHLVTADGLSVEDESIMADKNAIGNIIESKVNASNTSYRRLSSESDENKNVYLVTAGDEKLLKVEMIKADNKYKFGFSDWKEDKTILLSPDLQPKTINAQIPASSKLYVNGTEIPENYITDASVEIELLKNLQNWDLIGTQPKLASYSVTGIWMNPEVACSSDGGEMVACILQNNQYTAGFEASQDFIDAVHDRVIDCMEPYAYYFSGDAGGDAIANIMLDDSPAYDNATSADVSWMQEHSDVQITEKTAENFRCYSDGVFSCDISFLETIYQDEEAVKTWDTNMTWIFVRDGEEYFLADFITNVGD